MTSKALLPYAHSFDKIYNSIIVYMRRFFINRTSNFGTQCFGGRGLMSINLWLLTAPQPEVQKCSITKTWWPILITKPRNDMTRSMLVQYSQCLTSGMTCGIVLLRLCYQERNLAIEAQNYVIIAFTITALSSASSKKYGPIIAPDNNMHTKQ